MKTLTKANFRDVPWKNGGGTTQELYRIEGLDQQLLFRLSVARIESDGPFSEFPGMDRILLILKGAGVKLNDTVLKAGERPYHFAGETKIDCRLIENKVQDFNVMTARNWGEAKIKVIKRPIRIGGKGQTYAYSTDAQTLWVLDGEETYDWNGTGKLLIVTLTLK